MGGKSSKEEPTTDLEEPPTDLEEPPTDLEERPTDLEERPTDLEEQPTDLEQFDVPDEVESYPEPTPPMNRKRDIYRKEDYKKINTKAKKAPRSIVESYEKLINYLTDGLQTDVEKLKAMFAWMGYQSMQTRTFSARRASENTPLGYMQMIQEKRGTCATFFTHLCRKTGIPCVIIHGIAKGAAYESGMNESTCNNLPGNSWTAVYVSSGWRFIFPSFADVPSIGWQRNDTARRGRIKSPTDDYFFLTDPDEFIYFALPDQRKWQLLDVQWSSQKFIDAPMCRPLYFLNDLKITSEYSCRLTSEDGECIVSLERKEGMRFNYEIYYDNEKSGKELSEGINFDKYVFTNRTATDWEVHIRFPEIGVYWLKILGGNAAFSNEVICHFRLVCNEIKDDISPLPVNPTIGFGPSTETEKAALKVVSHKGGMVNATLETMTEYKFNLTKDVHISSRLVHNTTSSDDLQNCVTHDIEDTTDGKSLRLGVTLKTVGEFVLQMYADDVDRTWDEQYNFLNYLMSSNRPENPTQKRARKNLQIKAEEEDINGLEAAIRKFKELKLKNKGDLTRAKKELEFLKVRQALRDAIKRRHLNTLKEALSSSRNSRCSGRDQIKKLSEQAEILKIELESLGKICHDVMSMKQATIDELRSYHKTSEVVQNVMMATYLLLGEVEEKVQTWENIRKMLVTKGNQSLLNRVENFDTTYLNPAVVARVRDLVHDYDVTSVRGLSTGAGTFLVWVKNVITLVEKRQNQQAEDNK